MKKNCLLICYTNLAGDPRVIKHFEALKDEYDVITAGTAPVGSEKKFIKISESEFWDNLNNRLGKNKFLKRLLFVPLQLSNFLRFKVFSRFYYLRYWNSQRRRDYTQLAAVGPVDLIVCNDINTLPLGARLAGNHTKLVYDAHEYHAEEYAERPFWVAYNKPLINYLYARYLNRADICITVGENIAARYQKEYQRPFLVVYNAPPYLDLNLTMPKDAIIRLVYSGMYGANRKVDEVIRAMDYLPENYELNLLVTNVTDELKQLVESSTEKKRIAIHPAVPLHDVAKFINRFDIGVHLMASVNFNNDNALPNKYFQYIQARIVTAFGPLSEISVFTQQHGTGVICSGYTGRELADAVLRLSADDIMRIKQKNHENAKLFCEEKEIAKLKQVYKQAMV